MKARIYKPIDNPMQSGKAKNYWLLEYIEENTRSIDDLMGWSSNSSTKGQPSLKFKSKETAINYAEKNNIKYELILPKESTIKIKSYSDNFTD